MFNFHLSTAVIDCLHTVCSPKGRFKNTSLVSPVLTEPISTKRNIAITFKPTMQVWVAICFSFLTQTT